MTALDPLYPTSQIDSPAPESPYYGDLDADHLERVIASGISPEVARSRGYRTVRTKADLARLGFSPNQRNVPALLCPAINLHGETTTYHLRPNDPRIKNGKPLKYEAPFGARMIVDVPPAARPDIGNPSKPLFITEGIRKADSAASIGLCCVALLGVYNYRGRNDDGGLTALTDWEWFDLKNRPVYIAFDSDVMEKASVHLALQRLAAILKNRHANVSIIYLPPSDDGGKQGLDDYLAAGHSVQDLLAHASRELRPLPTHEDQDRPLYRSSELGIFKMQARGESPESRLTNFDARIIAEVADDDGSGDVRRSYEIHAVVAGEHKQFLVPAASFDSMDWVSENLGAKAVIYASDRNAKNHVSVAIRLLSAEDLVTATAYCHLGWRDINGSWVYLHAGGGLGEAGPVPDVHTKLPDALARFSLPIETTTEIDRRRAIRASLKFLDVAPDHVTFPLYAAIWRAPLGQIDSSIFLVGATGALKSSLVAIAQQHYGKGMDRTHLPGSWASTANANEAIAFSAKDAVFVVDDFAPKGTTYEIAKLHDSADRLLRGAGNNAGRARMKRDTQLNATKYPRGFIISTGEDVPKHESLRARMLILEVARNGPDAVRVPNLTACQRDALSGSYAVAMAGFLAWVAQDYDGTMSAVAEAVEGNRESAIGSATHLRLPEMMANLQAGMNAFLQYALEQGAITADEQAALSGRCWEALGEAAATQRGHHEAANSVDRFYELVRGGISSGYGYISNATNPSTLPNDAHRWGWVDARIGSETSPPSWQAQGKRWGWVSGNDLYLDVGPTFSGIQHFAEAQGDPLSVSLATFGKRLKEAGVLVSWEAARAKNSSRKRLDGGRRTLWHVRADAIWGDAGDEGDTDTPPSASTPPA